MGSKIFFLIVLLFLLGLPLVFAESLSVADNEVITLKNTKTGKYLSINSDDRSMDYGLNANRNNVGSNDWERFEVIKESGSGEISYGDRISLKTKRTANINPKKLLVKHFGFIFFGKAWLHANDDDGGEIFKPVVKGDSGEVKYGDEVYFEYVYSENDKTYKLDIAMSRDHKPAHLGNPEAGEEWFVICDGSGNCEPQEVDDEDDGEDEDDDEDDDEDELEGCENDDDCREGEECINGECDFVQGNHTCQSDQVIFKLSDITNAHGAMYDNEDYSVEVRYVEKFGGCYIEGDEESVHNCSGDNEVLGLDYEGNAHFSGSSDFESVCYGDLNCSIKENCGEDEMMVVSLSSRENAHISLNDDYDLRVCCSSSAQSCGDGVRDEGEECDDGNRESGDGCSEQCELERVCGNGIVERPNDEGLIEQCDGDDLNGFSEENLRSILLGASSDTEVSSSCGDNCQIDYSVDGFECGDDKRGEGELCDGNDFLNGLKCEDFGYPNCEININSSTSSCGDNCAPNLSVCLQCPEENLCGNGDVDKIFDEQGSVMYSEQCDGDNFGEWSCEMFGEGSGFLGCDENCNLDFSGCFGGGEEGEGEGEEGCNNNNICEDNEQIVEGCGCSDCHGYQAQCDGEEVCDYNSNSCESCPGDSFFEDGVCKPKIFSLEILKPDSLVGLFENKFEIGNLVEFGQKSYNSRKDLNVSWNLGDGNVEYTEGNCLTGGNCNISYEYDSFGHYTVSAKAEEIGGDNKRTNYTNILVYGEGINVFSIVSEPESGAVIDGGEPVRFNANRSFVSKCFDNEANCSEESGDCYGAGGLYCYDFNKSNIGALYDLLFEWTFDNGNIERSLNGTWSEDYDEVVDFETGFFEDGNYTAKLEVTYGKLEEAD